MIDIEIKTEVQNNSFVILMRYKNEWQHIAFDKNLLNTMDKTKDIIILSIETLFSQIALMEK